MCSIKRSNFISFITAVVRCQNKLTELCSLYVSPGGVGVTNLALLLDNQKIYVQYIVPTISSLAAHIWGHGVNGYDHA